jgi:hypothetical protein
MSGQARLSETENETEKDRHCNVGSSLSLYL